MFLLGFLVIGLLIGILSGGRIRNLQNYKLALPSLPLAALSLQILLFSEPLPTARWPLAVKAALHVSSYLLLLVFLALNLKKPGFAVIGIGLILNFAVITANGGFMPANPKALSMAGFDPADGERRTVRNTRIADKPRLELLGDVFAIPKGIPFSNAFSVGDVLIGLGAALAASKATLVESQRRGGKIVRFRSSR